jgi:putative transposase
VSRQESRHASLNLSAWIGRLARCGREDRHGHGVADLGGAIHHTDAGSQYTSVRFSEHLAEAGISASVGSVGDSFDNALAETINGLYKTELIKHRGPWRTVEQVEYATAE